MSEIKKTIFLTPNLNYDQEIKKGIKESKIKFFKQYNYDIDPTKLTKQIEKIIANPSECDYNLWKFMDMLVKSIGILGHVIKITGNLCTRYQNPITFTHFPFRCFRRFTLGRAQPKVG